MIEYLYLVIGFVLLVAGASYLIRGSTNLAKRLGVSELIVGLTILAFGTSLPELMVSILAAVGGNTQLALGNIIGSNISNTLLILGLSAVIIPLTVNGRIVWKEMPISIFAVALLVILSAEVLFGSDPVLGRLDGLILVSFFIVFLYYSYKSLKFAKVVDVGIKKHKDFFTALMILGGLAAVLYGSNLIVDNAVLIASNVGISQFLVSATFIAIGSSLPELVVSITAILKKKSALAVGNIVGSNIFNIFYILGITALISPVALPLFVFFDITFLLIASVLLFAFMFMGRKSALGKSSGITFLILYLIYLMIIIARG
jgi:cation:H+ antiporter